MTWGSIGRNVVCISSSLHCLSYCNSPPYLYFSFVGIWYVHSWSYFRCVPYFFMITGIVWCIRTFNATNKVCHLISTRVRPIISFLPSFYTPKSGLHILGVLMDFLWFLESFISSALYEDLSMIINVLMFVDPKVVFVMFSFFYAQQLNYSKHIIFPSWGILQHYAKFDGHTITMLKKLLGSKSFSTTMGHLACHQVIFLASLGGLGLPLMV
jgi:hypothetical protein